MTSNLSISLAKYNTEGLCAHIENEDMDQIQIHVNPCTEDVEDACRIAARRLRLLADAFDCLATMDRPCTQRAHDAALEAAKQSALAQPEPEPPQ